MVSPVMPLSRVDRGTRRIVLCGLTTVSAVVLLFSYRTSTIAELPEAAGTPDGTDVGAADAARADAGAVYGTQPEASEGYGTQPEAGQGYGAQPDPGQAAAVPAAAAPSGRARPAGAAYSGTVTGPVVQVKWGQVQVRATLAAGRITAVDVLRTPDENAHDRQVNAAAVPVLVRETLAAQSTRIDMVSGATFTSTGYVRSLQAALDRAGTT
jgi:uncharacterized protein with FMN-binding domain